MKILFTVVLALLTNVASAQKFKADADASSIKWRGTKIGGDHEGTINLKSGTLALKNGTILKGNFVINMTTIQNIDIEDKKMRAKLENHLRSDDFFNVQKYPEAKMKIKSAKSNGPNKHKVTADITIKGITKEITFDADLKEERDHITVTSKLKIDRAKFNVRYGSNSFFDNLGDKLIYNDFELKVTLIARK